MAGFWTMGQPGTPAQSIKTPHIDPSSNGNAPGRGIFRGTSAPEQVDAVKNIKKSIKTPAGHIPFRNKHS